MFVYVDLVPIGHDLCGPLAVTPRQDIEEDAETLVLQHRAVWMAFSTHARGPHCPCCPIVVTQAECSAPGFWGQTNYQVGAWH
jgi:hypothetical protein